MNTFDLTLDLDKSAGVTQWVAIRQGDKSGTTIRATIYDHGTALSGNYTARICMRLPDGTHFYEKDATLSGNVATVTIDETQAASVSGLTHNAYFQIIQGSAVVASTQDFTVKVLRDAMSDAEVGENYSTQIEQAVESLENMTSTIPTKVKDEVDAQLAAHPEWTTTVQDGSITKAKLATDLARDRERLMYRLDNLLTATPAEADALAVSDAAKTPLAGLALYGRSTQAGTPTPSAPVAIESVTPNLYDSANEPERTHNGVTWTTSAAGIKAVGTASGVSYIKGSPSALTDADMTFLPAGTYTVTNHDGATMAAWVYVGSVSSYTQVMAWGTAASTTFTVPDGGGYFRISLRVASGTTVDTTYRVSLNEGSSAAAGFVPYGYAGLWSKRTSDATQQSVTPITLQGHTLRSLPDGTRDEVTVDQYGHATLIQRVACAELDVNWTAYSGRYRRNISEYGVGAPIGGYDNTRCTAYASTATISSSQPADSVRLSADGVYAWLGANSTLVESTLLYPLATPVTIDLGTVDPIALQGPDMTAQSVPTAPFALTYERDLNVTLSRLEASIAELATN